MKKNLYILLALFLVFGISSCSEVVNSDENVVKERVYTKEELEKNIKLVLNWGRYFIGDTVEIGPFYKDFLDRQTTLSYGFLTNLPNTTYQLKSIALDTGEIKFIWLPDESQYYADFNKNPYYAYYDIFDDVFLFIYFRFYDIPEGTYYSRLYINDNKNIYWIIKCTLTTKN